VLSRQLDKKKFQPVVVSPRSYFAFTPLLASTAVGTLEFRTTLESVRYRRSGVEFYQGWADDVDFDKKRLTIEEAARRPSPPSESNITSAVERGDKPLVIKKKKGQVFDLKYDKLVVAVGCYSQTFGTPGVRENAFFLKDVTDAIKIRRRILECKSNRRLSPTSKLTKHCRFRNCCVRITRASVSCPTPLKCLHYGYTTETNAQLAFLRLLMN
jgi:NADH dehydrogenase FAD-containing subunit